MPREKRYALRVRYADPTEAVPRAWDWVIAFAPTTRADVEATVDALMANVFRAPFVEYGAAEINADHPNFDPHFGVDEDAGGSR